MLKCVEIEKKLWHTKNIILLQYYKKFQFRFYIRFTTICSSFPADSNVLHDIKYPFAHCYLHQTKLHNYSNSKCLSMEASLF